MTSVSSVPKRCLLLILLLVALTSRVRAFVTVVVELDPIFYIKPPACTAQFSTNFQSNLTKWVVNATRTISSFSDFNVPGGFRLTYSNKSPLGLRRKALATTTCSKCTSASCSVSCGLGTCNLCRNSRRRTVETTTLAINDKTELPEVGRSLVANWASVSASVTAAIKPQVIFYATQYGGGCLGNTDALNVIVTFVSDLVIDTTMNAAIVAAFGVPAPPPVSSPSACCSIDFTSCIYYCGTTKTQCNPSCDPIVGWMAKGPPPVDSCTPRWGGCSDNPTSCCPGLQCIGDNNWKGCFYIAP